jgi:ketosteroid isomerase-like protein
MTDRDTVRKLIEEAYAARTRGDIDGVMTAFHADGVFCLAGDPKALALAGTVEGHSNVREAMSGFIASFEFIERDILSMIIEGDRAAVHSRLKMRAAATDRTFTTELVDLFKVEDGKVAMLMEFADTALIKEVSAA